MRAGCLPMALPSASRLWPVGAHWSVQGRVNGNESCTTRTHDPGAVPYGERTRVMCVRAPVPTHLRAGGGGNAKKDGNMRLFGLAWNELGQAIGKSGTMRTFFFSECEAQHHGTNKMQTKHVLFYDLYPIFP